MALPVEHHSVNLQIATPTEHSSLGAVPRLLCPQEGDGSEDIPHAVTLPAKLHSLQKFGLWGKGKIPGNDILLKFTLVLLF